jgi:hypothetical protein
MGRPSAQCAEAHGKPKGKPASHAMHGGRGKARRGYALLEHFALLDEPVF